MVSHGRNENGGLRCLSIVVIQHSTEPLATLHLAGASRFRRIGQDQAVAEPLVIAFSVIMRGEFLDRFAQRIFAEQD